MSEREMRQVLKEVMEDVESGRVQVRHGRWARVTRVIGGGAIAATLALAACDEEPGVLYGVPDATGQYDSGTDSGTGADAATPDANVSDGAVVADGGTNADGAVVDGAVDEDGGTNADGAVHGDALVPFDGSVILYSVPPVDGGAVPEYGVPH